MKHVPPRVFMAYSQMDLMDWDVDELQQAGLRLGLWDEEIEYYLLQRTRYEGRKKKMWESLDQIVNEYFDSLDEKANPNIITKAFNLLRTYCAGRCGPQNEDLMAYIRIIADLTDDQLRSMRNATGPMQKHLPGIRDRAKAWIKEERV